MPSATDFMQLALVAAREGLGRTAPNPTVGAVIVRGDAVLGRGTTLPAGQSHAEPLAILDARARGHDIRGSTLYVTLEPCCHHGKTPPCTDAILDAGIARVVIGAIDPYPAVRGRGIQRLRQHGVEVSVGVERDACESLILGFARSVVHGLPEVTLKAGMSLDGHIATASGESQWITGTEARNFGQDLRASHDAIVVGIGTLLVDNPRLTCRNHRCADPVPVVFDSNLRTPSDAAIFRHPRRPIVLCSEQAPQRELPAEILRLPGSRPSIEAALRALAQRGLHRVLVEGGAALHRSFLDSGLIDAVELFIAPVTIPGGRSWLGGPDLVWLGEASRWGAPEVLRLGDDVRLRYAVLHRMGAPFIAPSEA